MHRSGTSALSGVLSHLDIELGNTTPGDKNNEKGYFESQKTWTLNDKLLTIADSHWDDPFFNEEKLELIRKGADKLLIKTRIEEDFKYAKLFLIKDPRMCLLFPVWEEVFNELEIELRIIIPYRSPLEVGKSLRKRDGFSMDKGIFLWAKHFLAAEKNTRKYKRCFTNYDALLADPQKMISDISTILSLPLLSNYKKNSKTIAEFLSKELKHNDVSMENIIIEALPMPIQKLIELKDKFGEENIIKEFDKINKDLQSYQNFFYNEDIKTLSQRFIEANKQKNILLVEKTDIEKKAKDSDNTIIALQKQQEKIEKESILRYEKLQEFTVQKNRLDNELYQSQKRIEILEKDTAIRVEKLQEMITLKSRLENDLIQTKKNFENHVENLQNQLQKANENINQLHQIKQKLEDQAKIQATNLEKELSDIYKSNSWRITKPLRKIRRSIL